MGSELEEKLDALRIDRGEEPEAPGRGRSLVVGLLVLVVAAGAVWFLARPRAVPVKTVVVAQNESGGAAAVLNASGYVTARRQATVSSKVTGKVVDVLVEEGMKVEKDQILARLDASQARQALALTEAQLEATRRSLVEIEAQRREATIRKKRVADLLAAGV